MAEDGGLDPDEFDPDLFYEDELDEGERQLLRAVAAMKWKSRSLFAELGDGATLEDRARVARERLTELHTEQVAAFDTLVAELAAKRALANATHAATTSRRSAASPNRGAKKVTKASTRQSATRSTNTAVKKGKKANS
jgi:hypothetical protein